MCCARHGAGVISKIKSVNKEEAHNWTFCFRLMAESYHDGPVPTSAITAFPRTSKYVRAAMATPRNTPRKPYMAQARKS